VFPLQLEPNASGSIFFKPVIFLALASFNRLLAYALTDAKPVGTGEVKTRSLALFRDLRRRVSVTVRRATSGMTCMCVGPPYHKYASYSRRRQMHCLRGSDGRVLMRHLPPVSGCLRLGFNCSPAHGHQLLCSKYAKEDGVCGQRCQEG
jgi:hypothetical protein